MQDLLTQKLVAAWLKGIDDDVLSLLNQKSKEQWELKKQEIIKQRGK